MGLCMKQATFFKIAIATNICFLFLIVQKSSKSIQLSYDRQKILNEKEELIHRHTELTHQLYANKSLSKVKQFALNELGMKPCTIKQVKPLALTTRAEIEPSSSDQTQLRAPETQRLAQNKLPINAGALNHQKSLPLGVAHE